MGDGGGGGGGGGGNDYFDSLSVIGGSGMGKAWGRSEAKGEGGIAKKAGKVFAASSLITQNAALALIATGLYLGIESIAKGTATPGEAPAVGNVDMAHPEISSPGLKAAGPGATETETAETAEGETAIDVKTAEQKAAEERRKSARKRTGYWSTRISGGGEADIFTPSMFSF